MGASIVDAAWPSVARKELLGKNESATSLGVRLVLLLGMSMAFAGVSGCGFVTNQGAPVRVPLNSDPPGAEILVDGESRGITPDTVALSRRSSHTIHLRREGHQTRTLEFSKRRSGAIYVADMLLGAVAMGGTAYALSDPLDDNHWGGIAVGVGVGAIPLLVDWISGAWDGFDRPARFTVLDPMPGATLEGAESAPTATPREPEPATPPTPTASDEIDGAPLQVRVTVSGANVRMGSSIRSQVLLVAPEGTVLPALALEGSWYRLSLSPEFGVSESTGFIHESTVERLAPPARQVSGSDSSGPKEARVVAVAASVREGPGTDALVLRTVRRGEVFPVMGEDGDWVEIQLPSTPNGEPESGFIFRSVVEVGPASKGIASASVAAPQDSTPGPPLTTPVPPEPIQAQRGPPAWNPRYGGQLSFAEDTDLGIGGRLVVDLTRILRPEGDAAPGSGRFEGVLTADYFFPEDPGMIQFSGSSLSLDVSYFELNATGIYRFYPFPEKPDISVFAGAGPHIARASVEAERFDDQGRTSDSFSDSEVGLNVAVGAGFREGEAVTPFVELRRTIRGGRQFVLLAGVLF